LAGKSSFLDGGEFRPEILPQAETLANLGTISSPDAQHHRDRIEVLEVSVGWQQLLVMK